VTGKGRPLPLTGRDPERAVRREKLGPGPSLWASVRTLAVIGCKDVLQIGKKAAGTSSKTGRKDSGSAPRG